MRANAFSGTWRFPRTQLSVIDLLRTGEEKDRERAFDSIVGAYWKPVYKYIRIQYRQNSDDAQDLTQTFFARVLEKDFFAGYDSKRARFRTFLRTCLERFLANEFKAATRQKRGGNAEILSLDFEAVEDELQSASESQSPSVEEMFDREWTRSVLHLAVEALRTQAGEQGRDVAFAIFVDYDLKSMDSDEKLTYGELATRYKISVSDVTNHLAAMRRQFRAIVLDIIRGLTTSDQEYRDEVRAVLGVDPQ